MGEMRGKWSDGGSSGGSRYQRSNDSWARDATKNKAKLPNASLKDSSHAGSDLKDECSRPLKKTEEVFRGGEQKRLSFGKGQGSGSKERNEEVREGDGNEADDNVKEGVEIGDCVEEGKGNGNNTMQMVKLIGEEEREMEVDGDGHMVGNAGLGHSLLHMLETQQHQSKADLNMLEGTFQQEELSLADKRRHGTFKRIIRQSGGDEGIVLLPTEKKRTWKEDAPNNGEKQKKLKVQGEEREDMDDLDGFDKAGLHSQSRRAK